MRPCDHPDGPSCPDTCRVCWLYENDQAYRNHWGVAPEDAKRFRQAGKVRVALGTGFR